MAVILVAQVAGADCKSDCKALTDKANKIIADQQLTIDLFVQENKKLQDLNLDLTASLNDTQTQLSAWYHNPFIIGTLGLLVGAAGATYLLKK